MKKIITSIAFCLFFFQLASSQTRTAVTINNTDVTVSSYTDKELSISGKSNVHITATTKTLINSVVNLSSETAWVYFDNVRPTIVIDSLLKYFTVNNVAAVNKTNVRVAIYKQGTVVIAQPSTYQPLKVYTGQNFTGDSASYGLFTFNNAFGTTIDNKIRSFKLKRGYMATVAISTDGTGFSRVFIADDKDLEVSILPNTLDNTISFIRVVNWEWVSKKGWCGYNPIDLNLTKSTWRYDWSAGGATTSTVEYVPIRQNGGWPAWTEISGKQYSSHVLGFNEPDHTEQSNLTVSQAVAQWPEMLKTGLRVGSPACTNFSWLYQFMDSCKAKNYRVDYVAVHAYWGGKSPANWYNDLKYIHTMTGRPIWITEWNNGANWTTESWPTADHSLSAVNAAKQLADLKAILTVLDTASFIERYSIYNWVQDCRAMTLGDSLTPAGKYYAADNSVMAFNRKKEVLPTFTFGKPNMTIAYSTKKLTLSMVDPNSDFFRGFILEKKMDSGAYAEFFRVENSSLKTFTDTLDLNAASKVRYRARSIMMDGTISAYTDEVGYDVTNGGDIQTGILGFQNVGWNTVFFKKAFTSTNIPAIILGATTNNNSSVLMAARAKLISATSRFTVQLAPWTYQNITTLTKEESVPYFI
ncbi:MAG: glycosyl hydrolase, partial [Paludibacter sp.]